MITIIVSLLGVGFFVIATLFAAYERGHRKGMEDSERMMSPTIDRIIMALKEYR